MTQYSRTITAVAILLLITASTLTTIQRTEAAPAASGGNWWDNSFQFRRPVTIVNDGSTPLANQTVFLRLNFTGFDAEDPAAGVRVVGPSGGEIPSVVVGAQYSGPFLRSVYLLFDVNIPPKSSLQDYIYYGSAFNPTPAYRSIGPSSPIVNGFVKASLEPTSKDSVQVRLDFGTVDSETAMSAVSYSSPVSQKYGPTTISTSPFTSDTGLIAVGQLNAQKTVGYEEVRAGSIWLTRILVLSPKSVETIDALANFGTVAVTGVNLTSLVGLDGLANLGSSHSAYNSASGLLYTLNPDAYFGVQQSAPAYSFALGPRADVTAEAATGHFSGVASYSLAGAAGFTWRLGDLSPYGSAWIASAWGVGLSLATLSGALPAVPIGAVVGVQEVHGIATPSARSIWYGTVDFTNLAVTSGGLALPLGLGGAEFIPAASHVDGTYTYIVPPSPQQNPRAWTQSTTSHANATSFASSQYYAFDLGTSVQRLAGTVPNSASTATASLISVPTFAFRGTNAVLQVKYKASYIVTGGSLSSQDLFISADLDPTLTNHYSENIVIPLSGSSTTVPTSGCPPSGTLGTTFEQVTPPAFLVGDGTWRTLSVSLPSSLPASGFNLILRTCLSTSSGFAGVLDLEVASVGIVLKGAASEFIASSFSQSPSELTLGLLPQASLLSEGAITANLTVSLVSQLSATIGWQDSSTFSGTMTTPSQATVGNNAFGPFATSRQASFGGILLDSALSNLTETSQISGAAASVSPSQGISLITGGPASGLPSAARFTIGLRSEPVSVSVQDRNNVGVQGVTVTPSVEGKAIPSSSVTDSSGIARFTMVPWTFGFNATYEGTPVGTTQLATGSQQLGTITANIFHVVLMVKDSRGGALAGAQINLRFGNSTFLGETDGRGEYPFEAVAKSVYDLTVGVGTGTYFTGPVGTGINNEIVVITTTYFPASLQLAIILLIAIVPVALIAAFLVARRIGKRQ